MENDHRFERVEIAKDLCTAYTLIEKHIWKLHKENKDYRAILQANCAKISPMNEKEIALKNVLALAFVGDAFMSLYIKQGLVMDSNVKVAKLHDMASKAICAKAQSQLFDTIHENLSEIEKEIANRARNANVNTVPSSCTLIEYKKATALEAVIGYNVLIGDTDRAISIICGTLIPC